VAADEVLALLDGVNDLYVARGRKMLHVDLSAERPADEDLVALLCSRFGKLRAPTMRSGDRLVVGYNAEMLATLLSPEG
jgi:arsenate reductase-like glutaredoxin family protein